MQNYLLEILLRQVIIQQNEIISWICCALFHRYFFQFLMFRMIYVTISFGIVPVALGQYYDRVGSSEGNLKDEN